MEREQVETVMDEVPHVQVKLISNSTRLSMPDHPFSVPVNLDQEILNRMTNQLMSEGDANWTNTDFDFLIEQELLRTSLHEYIKRKGLTLENLIYIECIQRTPPPVPDHAFNHADWVGAVHISNNRVLTGCYDNAVYVWNHDGGLLLSLDGHGGPVKDVKWVECEDPRHSVFLSGSQDQYIYVWKWDTERSAAEVSSICKGHARSVEGVAINSDGVWFASVSWDKMLKVWSLQEMDRDDADDKEGAKRRRIKGDTAPQSPVTKTPILTLAGHTQAVTGVVWSSSSDIITCGWDHCIRIWDVEAAVNKSNLMGSKVFNAVDWSPLNGLVASASSDPYVRIWDPRDKDGSVVKLLFSPHKGWVKNVKWTPLRSDQLVSGSYDSFLKLWDMRSPRVPLYSVAAHEGKVLCVGWSPSGLLLASGGTDGKLRTYKLD